MKQTVLTRAASRVSKTTGYATTNDLINARNVCDDAHPYYAVSTAAKDGSAVHEMSRTSAILPFNIEGNGPAYKIFEDGATLYFGISLKGKRVIMERSWRSDDSVRKVENGQGCGRRV